MRGSGMLASAVVFAATLVGTPAHAARPRVLPPATRPAHESPLACDRNGLAAAERKRHFDELGPRLRALRKSTHELADGYEFAFPSDRGTFALLTEWMIQERACCPFFELSLRLEREGGPMWLRLTGREGVKEFIRTDFPDAWFPSRSD